MADIAPLTIGAGTYRVAGLVGSNSHLALSNNNIGNGVTISSRYVRTNFPNGGFNFPNLDFGSQAIRATLSTDSVSAVPEPSSLALFGIGACLAGVGVARRRRKTKGVRSNSVRHFDCS